MDESEDEKSKTIPQDDVYSLDELIDRLENIKAGNSTLFNFPRAFYCLALEIQELKCKAALHEHD